MEQKQQNSIQNLPAPIDANGQTILFDQSTWKEHVIVESERARGIFTFERMMKNEPERAEAILSLLIEPGISQRHIARVCKCSRNSVAAAMRWALENQDKVEPLKKRSAALWGTVKQLSAERAIELLNDDDYKPKLMELGMLGGTAQDKELLLRGEATQRVEKVASAPGFDDFAEEVRGMRQAQGVVPSPSPNTGSEAEESAPKGTEAAELPAPGDCPESSRIIPDHPESGGRDDG